MNPTNFVEVLVADATYHQSKPLTYTSRQKLSVGQIVVVKVRQKEVLAVVVGLVNKPFFKVKEVMAVPNLPPLPKQLLQLLDWMASYYPGPFGFLTQIFLPKKIALIPEDQPESLPPPSLETLPTMTNDQLSAMSQISNGQGLHLLHGETGTGKTRVYIELATQCVSSGKSAIILIPEIGLTSQIANDFRRVFGERVVLMHSGLSETNRAKNWQYILLQDQPLVIIGARSALFSPARHLGLIVIDEAHETAYKQDQSPYYHASPVAAKLASLHGATLVLGTATPLVSDYFFAEAKKRPIIRMSQTAVKSEQTDEQKIKIVDLKDKNQFSKSPYLSDSLIKLIQQSLANQTQTLLFLNRRGTARVVFCESCGWQALCPHCDLPLVYHSDSHTMRCHSCSFRTHSPTGCPECGYATVVFKSVGTKAITDEAKRIFPNAKVMRFDNDNKKGERIEQNYDAVRRGDVDIIVGTQTLAKGLDLPKLSTIGIVIADTGLYLPDFTAQERTYQLLHQVIGRANRGHMEGRIVIQTFKPDSDLLKNILQKNWYNFYNTELSERKSFLFPPFCYLLKLTCKRSTSASAQKAAELFAEKLRGTKNNIIIEGPSPSFHEKSQGKFAWQLIIKTKQRDRLVEIIKILPSGWSYDIDPMNLL